MTIFVIGDTQKVGDHHRLIVVINQCMMVGLLLLKLRIIQTFKY